MQDGTSPCLLSLGVRQVGWMPEILSLLVPDMHYRGLGITVQASLPTCPSSARMAVCQSAQDRRPNFKPFRTAARSPAEVVLQLGPKSAEAKQDIQRFQAWQHAELVEFDLLDPSQDAVAAFQACSSLDGDQVTALLACLGRELTCVQGPPGTGMPQVLRHVSSSMQIKQASACDAPSGQACKAAVTDVAASYFLRLPATHGRRF